MNNNLILILNQRKICTCCGMSRFVWEFPVNRRAIDGHISMCKECNNAKMRAWYAKTHRREYKDTWTELFAVKNTAFADEIDNMTKCDKCGKSTIRKPMHMALHHEIDRDEIDAEWEEFDLEKHCNCKEEKQ